MHFGYGFDDSGIDLRELPAYSPLVCLPACMEFDAAGFHFAATGISFHAAV
jgi:hypothetical protein